MNKTSEVDVQLALGRTGHSHCHRSADHERVYPGWARPSPLGPAGNGSLAGSLPLSILVLVVLFVIVLAIPDEPSGF